MVNKNGPLKKNFFGLFKINIKTNRGIFVVIYYIPNTYLNMYKIIELNKSGRPFIYI